MFRMGYVDEKLGWDFVKSLENKLVDEKWNGKVNKSGRKCLWFGVGVELGFNSYCVDGLKIGENLRKRGNELWGGDDWNSILIYKYEAGVELKTHVDREIFDNKTVVVNLCKGFVGFRWGGRIYWLEDGEWVEFDNGIEHGVLKCGSERWSIQFRKVLV